MKLRHGVEIGVSVLAVAAGAASPFLVEEINKAGPSAFQGVIFLAAVVLATGIYAPREIQRHRLQTRLPQQ